MRHVYIITDYANNVRFPHRSISNGQVILGFGHIRFGLGISIFGIHSVIGAGRNGCYIVSLVTEIPSPS